MSFNLGVESATFLHRTEKNGVLIHATNKRFFENYILVACVVGANQGGEKEGLVTFYRGNPRFLAHGASRKSYFFRPDLPHKTRVKITLETISTKALVSFPQRIITRGVIRQHIVVSAITLT